MSSHARTKRKIIIIIIICMFTLVNICNIVMALLGCNKGKAQSICNFAFSFFFAKNFAFSKLFEVVGSLVVKHTR